MVTAGAEGFLALRSSVAECESDPVDVMRWILVLLVSFLADEKWNFLKNIFPSGICDCGGLFGQVFKLALLESWMVVTVRGGKTVDEIIYVSR